MSQIRWVRRHVGAALAWLALGGALPAAAQSLPAVNLGVTFGTLGIGPEIDVHNLGAPLGLRIEGSVLGLGYTTTVSGTRYKGNLDATGAGAIADYYPFANGIRVSAGMRVGAPRVKVTANPTGNVTIGNGIYSAASVGSLTGTDTLDAVAPYVGIGYATTWFDQRLSSSIDAGVLFEGAGGNLHLTSSGPLANDPSFQSNLAVQSAKVRKQMRVPVYPVIQLSLGYHF